MNTPLQHAAWAVIARWDSPAWKDMPHTGEYIEAMRKALADEQAQAVEPLVWVRKDQLNQMASGFLLSAFRSTEGRTDLTPLFTHPAPPAQQVAVPAPLSDFDMRGVLATKLLCWHRLTEAEAQDLICFFEKVNAAEAKQAQAVEPLGAAFEKILHENLWDLYETDKPAQQVAVPVPLSGYEITKWWASENDLEDCNMCIHGDFERVVRAIEARHGITQGDSNARKVG